MSIEIKNVTYTYMPKTPFERTALKDVDLVIEEGSFTAIAGHTGSGKSTLVQHLNGLLEPTSGQVLVDGVDLNGKGSKSEKLAARDARRKVGMVFQYAEHQLFEETIFADIAFAPRNLGLGEEEVEERVKEAMSLVGLGYEEFKDKSPFQLSGGQMRRVAIAGILAMQPKYLVLDEPTAGLDAAGKDKLIQEILQLHEKRHITMIFVSHNMDDIACLADKVLFMNQGRVLLYDTPARAFQAKDTLQEAGLCPPQIMSFLEDLRDAGIPVDTNALTVEEGIANIMKAVKGKNG
ncbi:MAG: energy-coupling factor transporter ATPase [Selenomonadaceae bacterium]|nr:energy-coupling factor transporter ATPase [Selenomonadaceae bacterium]MBQ3972263.1 energy-coupling factor transporter ATPase [Selenomonadaceae bacterium]